MPPLYDQGQLGSCTANAIAAAVEYDRLKQGIADFTPCRLFLYYNERAAEGTVSSDAGANICDGISAMQTIGDCQETDWPYTDDPTTFIGPPPAICAADAAPHKDLQQQQVEQSTDGIRAVLADGHPVVFGFTVYESFESDAVASTGIVPMPQPGEQVLGGHAVLIVGYDDAHNWFIVRNSWGPEWGQAGYFTMPYQYVTDPTLASDFWAVMQVE
jgi:C1A family cysteine protease